MAQKLAEIFIELGQRSDWPEHYESPEILRSRMEYYSSKLMDKYEPDRMWNFQYRLENWLANINDIEDKFLLLNSLSFFTFFNKEQCDALYQEALNGPVIRWLIDIKNYNVLDLQLNKKLDDSINHTCFSAATDSMHMDSFRHITGITNSNSKIWRDYINEEDTEEEKMERISLCKKDLRTWKHEQIVVLEDFIGSGRQSESVINFLRYFDEWKILFVPLVICPQGDLAISQHLAEKKYAHISYEPISVLPWKLILAENDRRLPEDKNPEILRELEIFAEKIHTNVVGKNKAPGYLGFGNIGALFAKYTNCPNNTLPLIWYAENKNWEPLFERSERKSNAR